jgi:hypothetical protein
MEWEEDMLSRGRGDRDTSIYNLSIRLWGVSLRQRWRELSDAGIYWRYSSHPGEVERWGRGWKGRTAM